MFNHQFQSSFFFNYKEMKKNSLGNREENFLMIAVIQKYHRNVIKYSHTYSNFKYFYSKTVIETAGD